MRQARNLLALPILAAAVLCPAPPSPAASGNGRPGPVAAALSSISPGDVHDEIAYLASDAFRGRNAGTKENDRVAAWIADDFSRIGLEPGGDGGTFLQHFTFLVRGSGGREARTQNVVGIWRGTDPRLAREAVIIGAHYDHVGAEDQMNNNPGRLGKARGGDTIWNGADDNASGTAGVLEVAEAFAAFHVHCRRTLVFICFGAEEQGLVGSRYYADHPVFPLEDTVAMINMDMIGRNPGGPLYLIAADSASDDGWKKIVEACSAPLEGRRIRYSSSFLGGSDHFSFLMKGVPALFFFTGLHRDYHHVGDEADRIHAREAASVARTVFLMARALADREDRLAFNESVMKRRGRRPGGKRLGVVAGEPVADRELEGHGFDPDQGAVRVARVLPGSAAAAADLRTGDLILALDAVRILKESPLRSLRKAVQASPDDRPVTVEVLRKGRRVICAFTWPETAPGPERKGKAEGSRPPAGKPVRKRGLPRDSR